jgi:hypothetical protein
MQSAAAMFKEAEDENRLITWLVRLGGMVAMWLGAALILRPLVVVADFVPFIGSILGAGAALVALAFTVVVGPVVIALAWLWYRPLVSVVVLAIGVAAGVGLRLSAMQRAPPCRQRPRRRHPQRPESRRCGRCRCPSIAAHKSLYARRYMPCA